MWVRSQSKCYLVDVKGYFINNEYNIVGWMCEPSTTGNQWTLGTYKTEEKAMKVLDELQYRIARTESGVYQMPEDEQIILNNNNESYEKLVDKALKMSKEILELGNEALSIFCATNNISKEELKDCSLKGDEE